MLTLPDFSLQSFRKTGIFLLACHLSKALGEREQKQSFYEDEDDLMNMDEPLNSQMTSSMADVDQDVPRHDLQARNDIAALRACCSTYCHLITSLRDSSNENLREIPTEFVDHLVSLKESVGKESLRYLLKTPVTGSNKDDRSPTSGNVHLYLDPETADKDLPILYADCEGLEGGETKPRANMFSRIFKSETVEDLPAHTQRPIKVSADKNPKEGTREWAVKTVYPRLLYTFSDTIVFVLQNTR